MLRDYANLRADPTEYSVIGSMLIDETVIPALVQELTPEDFYSGDTRHMFEAIRDLFLQRREVDAVTVLGALGEAYRDRLYAAVDLTPSAANCREYAKQLRDRRLLRAIQAACTEIINEGTDLQTARALLSNAAALLVEKQNTKDRSYSELLSDLLTAQEDRTPPDYLDFGIEALNKKLQIGGGRFVILGADSSVGKTALALQFALSIAKEKRVGFFSYETTLMDATHRLAANDADVSLRRIKSKLLSTQDTSHLVGAGLRSGSINLRIMETARYTVEDIRAKTIARGFDVIFLDYVQLIPTRKNDRYEAVTEISIGLHALAQELGVTVIGLSQVTVPEVNKKGQRRYITKDDLRESRQLKQDADVILLLDLDDPTKQDGDRILQIAKNRDGPLAHMSLSFDAAHMRFRYIYPSDDPAVREQSAEKAAKQEEQRKKAQEQAAAQAAQSSMFGATETATEEIPF